MFHPYADVAYTIITALYLVHFFIAFVKWRSINRDGDSNGWVVIFELDRLYFYLFFALAVPITFQFVATSFYVLFDETFFVPGETGGIFLLSVLSISVFSTLIAVEGTTLGIVDRRINERPENPFRRHVLASLFVDILALIVICGFLADQLTILTETSLDPPSVLEAIYMIGFLVVGLCVSIFVLSCRLFAQRRDDTRGDSNGGE